MKLSPCLLLLAISQFSFISCRQTGQAPPQQEAARQPPMEELVTANKKFVNAFKGKSVAEAKKLLGEASYQESAWSDHGVPGMQGKEIIASYPNCEVMLYSLDDEVIMAGIHIMAD